MKDNHQILKQNIEDYIQDDALQETMDTYETLEKSGRIEQRTAYSTCDVDWLLDVNFEEDFCRVEDKNGQQNLNIIRKIVLSFLIVSKITKNEICLNVHFQKLCLILDWIAKIYSRFWTLSKIDFRVFVVLPIDFSQSK